MTLRTLSSRLGRALVAWTFAAWCAGCGNAPAPPATSPAPAAIASAAAAPAAPDLSEVAEPAQLVALVRWRSPQATLDTVSQWMGLHLSAAELAAEAIDRSIAETLRFDAPIDAAVALDPDAEARGGAPLFAVAVGARSLEDARRAVGVATEVAPGQYRVRLGHGKRKAELPFCMLSAAPGAAPARFVCGRRERDVDALYPYLTRTAPRRNLGSSDLHAELRAARLFSAYGSLIDQGLRMGATLVPRRLEVGEPAFDRALGRATLAITEELGALAADLDTLTLDVAVQPERAKAALAIAFRSRQSWTAALLASQEARAGAPPAMFYRLPRTASSASYGFRPESRRLEAIHHALGELLDGWLLHEGLDMADRAAIADLVNHKYWTDAAMVSATGSFATAPGPSSPKGSKSGPPSSGDESGWYMLGIDTPNQAVDFVKSLAAALGRPKIQAYIKAKLADVNGKASLKIAPLTMKSVPPPKDLPKGSLDYELKISREAWLGVSQQKPQQGPGDAGAAAGATMKVHLLVVPERTGQTWILLGEGRPELSLLARTAAEGDKENETLAQRPELAALKDDKLVGAGFTTFEAFLKPWPLPLSSEPRTLRERRTMLQSTPNKGKTPMFFRFSVAARDALVATTDFTIPRGAIEDLVIFATTSSLLGATNP